MIVHIVQSLEIYNIFQNKIFVVPTGVSRYSDKSCMRIWGKKQNKTTSS